MAYRFRLARQGLLVAALGLSLGACQSGTNDEPAAVSQWQYPHSEQQALVETLHGVEVGDPYRHLEENTPKTEAWVKAQQQFGQDYLANIANKQAVVARITELWNFEKISAPFENGDNQFYYRNDGLQAQAVLYVKGLDGVEKPLLDPNTF
ncbi:MAG: S9 family peptidase, partial [Shewanella sp.]